MQSDKMATSSSGSSGMSSGGSDHVAIPMVQDQLTFDGRQELRLKDLEKKIEADMKRKKRDWEKEVQRMRQEFLTLYPSDRTWGSEEMLTDPMIIKRKGSTDVLDIRKMRTVFLEYPDCGRRFKLRFNCIGFDPRSVRVTTDGERIVVRASMPEEDEKGETIQREYVRKIEKPKEVDINKIKSFLTCDGILVVDASLPPHSLALGRKLSHSPTHSSVGSQSHASSRSRSPSNSPRTPTHQKPGVPIYIDAENGIRRMSLLIEIGPFFKPKDITVQIIKENRIKIKAKNEERTSERLCKNKFAKEFELPEKIEAFTIRGGLSSEGKLLVGAIVKGHNNGMTVEDGGNWIKEELGINNTKFMQCNVLDLASFPPTNVSAAFVPPPPSTTSS